VISNERNQTNQRNQKNQRNGLGGYNVEHGTLNVEQLLVPSPRGENCGLFQEYSIIFKHIGA
jgi:hypothetical protein